MLKIFVISTILWLAYLFDAPAFAQEHVLEPKTLHILYYDNIEYEEDPYELSKGLAFDDFKKHLDFFKNEAYNVIDLHDTPSDVTQRVEASNIQIAIILNAHDKEAMKYAAPLMKRYGYPVSYAVNPSDKKDQNSDFYSIKNTLLSIKITDKQYDFKQKNLNDETSRFRDIFKKTPRFVMVDDAHLYKQQKGLFSLYNFEKIFIPTNEANDDKASKSPYSYIKVLPSFSNLDIMQVYLNRRMLPYYSLVTQKHNVVSKKEQAMVETSWGISLPYPLLNNKEELVCVSQSNQKARILSIEDRIEIRLLNEKDAPHETVHCTLPIYYKNGSKSDAYYYTAFHEPS